jgi:membrane protease YdiL (CAAX protease family)
MPENESIETPELLREPTAAHRTLAPAWHTALLIMGILGISVAGKLQLTHAHSSPNRLLTYATTAAMELLMLGWVALGLRLSRTPFRTLFGAIGKGFRIVLLDLGIAAVFWIGSLMVLGTLGLVWTSVEFAASHWHELEHGGQTGATVPRNRESLRAVEQLAPANGAEIACWVLLCCLAGTIEETVFRGYLQNQFTAWTKGGVAWGVVFSALLFGAAHGYQGARNMVLLAVFGALFSGLAILRRSLRAGIFVHSWHDLIAGLVLTFLRSRHLL